MQQVTTQSSAAAAHNRLIEENKVLAFNILSKLATREIESPNWGHVGDATRVNNLLQELKDLIN
jgi:hypothetical protein